MYATATLETWSVEIKKTQEFTTNPGTSMFVWQYRFIASFYDDFETKIKFRSNHTHLTPDSTPPA